MTKVTLESSKMIFSIGKVFATVPHEKSANKFLKYIYPIIVLTANIVIMIVSAYGRIHHFSFFEITSFILACASDVALILCSLVSIASVNYLNYNKLIQMQDCMRQIEYEQRTKLEQTSNSFRTILILSASWIIFLICNLALIIPLCPWYVKYFLLRELQNYQVLVTTIVMKNYVYIIKDNFRYLNEVLKGLKAQTFPIGELDGSQIKDSIDMISGQYTKLTFIIRTLNDVFGVYYVFVYIYIVIYLLVPLNIAIVFGGNGDHSGDHKYGKFVVLLALVWCTFPWMIFRDLFLSGELLTNECEKITENCYKAIMVLSDKYRNSLRELAMQAGHCNTQLSANGWFEINYKMILPTITMIISYLIVLIQYHD